MGLQRSCGFLPSYFMIWILGEISKMLGILVISGHVSYLQSRDLLFKTDYCRL